MSLHTIWSRVSNCFVLRAAVLALKHDDPERPNLDPLAAGTCLHIAGEPRESGLIAVSDRNGARYTLFYSDLLERSQAVQNATG